MLIKKLRAKNVHCRFLEVEGLEESIQADKDVMLTLVVEVTKTNLNTSVLKLQGMLIKKCLVKNVHCRLLEVESLVGSINADNDAMHTLVVEVTKVNRKASVLKLQWVNYQCSIH